MSVETLQVIINLKIIIILNIFIILKIFINIISYQNWLHMRLFKLRLIVNDNILLYLENMIHALSAGIMKIEAEEQTLLTRDNEVLNVPDLSLAQLVLDNVVAVGA